ncbi:hypothetical protein [Variovorax sp. dw_308]|uniref:hypothetical protein n=1 Tax=Variovorax sp. dw_308 TaxID=2721546 RepID=UPI001C48BEBA|nr:hypothetical protein [Variovorax sp. dw_308]
MATLLRWFFGLAWVAAAGLLWHEGALRAGWALALAVPVIVLLAWPSSRRRRGDHLLQYVHMTKEPC